jgi:hypothetical protein
MDKLTEGLKFLEDHTKSFFSDLERISLTVLLLYLAAPNAIVTAYLYLQGVIASALSVVTKLLQVDELDHSTHVILNLVFVWILYQMLTVMHHSFLAFVHDTLPDMIVQLYKPDNITEMRVNNISLIASARAASRRL